MCGIVGVTGNVPVYELLLAGLRRLEERGYDSAGIATLDQGRIDRRRALGKIDNLAGVLFQRPLWGETGIGHTRWATHGKPTEDNAHPHISDGVAVVHNGVIENNVELRARLKTAGFECVTPVDTEVIAHLIALHRKLGLSPVNAARAAIKELRGAFALAILLEGNGDHIVVARQGCPLVLGVADDAMYVGSADSAVTLFTTRVKYLQDGDVAVVGKNERDLVIYDAHGNVVTRPTKIVEDQSALIGKGNHRHHMEREIFEQPEVLGETYKSFVDRETHQIQLPNLPFNFRTVSRIAAVACGTSAYALLVSKYWFQDLARIPVDWEIASEFRYANFPLADDQVGIFTSQSGETADTLGAMLELQAQGKKALAIVNVANSAIARAADGVLRTLAGREVSVASTKAFTTQLATLLCLAVGAGLARGTLSVERAQEITEALDLIPAQISQVLAMKKEIKLISKELSRARDVAYVGRGTNYAVALEGSLKLKEISYIHAEAFAAGELKHGPIALIDENVPVVVIAPSDCWYEKTASNLQEIEARGGRVILLSDARGVAELGHLCAHTFTLPKVNDLVAPMLYAAVLQLLAYQTAVLKGTDVDQPRNLAKSVTVE